VSAERPAQLPRRRLRRCAGGSAALEFAAVMPAFLALAFAIVDFSRYAFTLVSVRQAAAEAVRAASMGRPAAEVQALARARAPFLGSGLTVTCQGCGVTDVNQMMTYRVTAAFTFQPLAPLLPAFTVNVADETRVSF
jgi:Flp pilus assembly protein TadG